MRTAWQETEVKFFIRRPKDLEKRILETGGRLSRPRTLEANLRFDTASGALRASGRVLRLRRDASVYLTFKAETRVDAGALQRTEIELTLDDFEAAELLLRGLDYKIVFKYEKYRTVFSYGPVELMLDELPYGHFVEIEGEREALEPAASQLGLNWPCAIPRSYHALFERVQDVRALPFADLTFENFAGLAILPDELGVTPADD